MEMLIANPSIVFREEFDDWALLYDPDTGNAYGLNPVSTFIWKNLDGGHTIGDISRMVLNDFSGVPDNVDDEIAAFLSALKENGFAGTDLSRGREKA